MKLPSHRHLASFCFPLFLLFLFTAPAAAHYEQQPMDSVIVTITNPDTIMICAGQTIVLNQENNVNDADLQWRPANGALSPLDSTALRIAPTESRYYAVRVGTDAGIAEDSIYVEVDVLVLPELIGDTTVCEGVVLPLLQQEILNTRGTQYHYALGDLSIPITDPNVVFDTRDATSRYFRVVATSANAACSDSVETRIEVIQSKLEILGEDTLFKCNTYGRERLTVTASPGDPNNITWFTNSGTVTDNAEASIDVNVTNDATYYASATVNGCPQIDSIAIRVDSLPEDLILRADPAKDPYCPGDTFYLLGNIFDVADYPLIEHEWVVAPGMESPANLYNGIFTATDTTLYQRLTRNGACVDTAEIPINVVQPPILIFDPAAPTLCEPEPFQVTVSFDPSGPTGTLEWMDPIGGTLSCDDCLDPVITTSQTVTYTIEVTAEGSECPFSESYTVFFVEDALPTLTNERTVCAGTSLNLIVGNIFDDYEYVISGGGQVVMGADGTVTVSETTSYTVTSTSPTCPSQTQTITIEVLPTYTLDVTAPNTVCPGEEFTIASSVSPDTEGTYRITNSSGVSVEGPDLVTSILETDTFTVRFTDAFGCGYEFEQVVIDADGLVAEPVIVATVPGQSSPLASVIRGGRVEFSLSGLPDTFDGTINWTGNGNPERSTGRSIVVTAPNDNTPGLLYRAMISGDGLCAANVQIDLPIVEEPYQVPEIISANKDGQNDDFQVFFQPSVDVTNFSLSVWNRWGQEVFTSTNPTEGWDGTKDGKPQNLDTYLYLATFNLSGQEVELEGQFILVR